MQPFRLFTIVSRHLLILDIRRAWANLQLCSRAIALWRALTGRTRYRALATAGIFIALAAPRVH